MKNRVVYLAFKRNDGKEVYDKGIKYINDLGSLVTYSLGGKFICVTTTINCLKQNNWLDDLNYEMDGPTYHHIPSELTLKLILNYYK